MYKLFGVFFIVLLFNLNGFAQTKGLYPQTADDLTALVDHFVKTNFSTNDAVKKLGTIKKITEDEEESGEYIIDESSIYLQSFSANGKNIQKIFLYTDEDASKFVDVTFTFASPVNIQYGTIVTKYGSPEPIRPPIINCGRNPNCNRNPFVGYVFKYKTTVNDKKVDIRISLRMKMTDKMPKHTNKSVLAVEEIRISIPFEFEEELIEEETDDTEM